MIKTKLITLTLCVFGIITLAYGMQKGDDAVFILGLLLVIVGYLLVRRRLKESIRQAQREDESPPGEP